MKTLLTRSSLALLALALGCSNSTPTRNLTGQVTVSAYSVKNPFVIARSTAGRTFVTNVSSTGAFKLTVPTGASYRLVLADRTNGKFTAVSRISWPIASRAHWAKVRIGSTIQFGAIHPRAAVKATSGVTTLTDGTGGDTGGDQSGENKNDDGKAGDVQQCGSQLEQTGDNQTEQQDNCEDDKAEVCADAGGETDSEGDVQDQSNIDNQDGATTETESEADSACGGTTGGGTTGGTTPGTTTP